MDSDQEFLELRALTELLLANQKKDSDLPLIQKLILSEQLRYCYYKLTKFNCPKAWTESDRASVLLFEMMKPDLIFKVPTSRIRHRLCSCISSEEVAENREKARKLAELLVNSEDGFSTVISEERSQLSTPSEIPVVESEDPIVKNEDQSSAQNQQTDKEEATSEAFDAREPLLQTTTIEELESAAFPELFDNSDEEDVIPNLPEALTDVSVVRELVDGELPPPKLLSTEFAVIAAKARYDNFLNAKESNLCEFTKKKRSPRRLRGVVSVTAEHGQLTMIRPGRRTIMKDFTDTTTFCRFFKDIEDSIYDKQDLYEHLCLYYWFKNVVRNKGVHKRHWLECPTILSRGDNSLQALSYRAIPLTLGQFCEKMV